MIDLESRIELTHADKHSGTWDKVQRYWAQQLVELRMRNDHDMSEVETAKLRGRIQQVKAFLSMDKDMPTFEPPKYDAAE